MDSKKKARLEAAGWRVGDAQEFLGLTDEEVALIKLKIALSNSVRERRLKAGLTQAQLAKRIGSSQSRINKLEGATADATVDFALKALFALGMTHKTLGRIVGRAA